LLPGCMSVLPSGLGASRGGSKSSAAMPGDTGPGDEMAAPISLDSSAAMLPAAPCPSTFRHAYSLFLHIMTNNNEKYSMAEYVRAIVRVKPTVLSTVQ
jgi:hypothetical protein